MKTQHQHVLIYDQDCPFCNWYTGAFVRKGFLLPEGRLPYKDALNDESLVFDEAVSRNKIALVNRKTGEVLYGIDSLLAVFANRFPLIQQIGTMKPVNYVLRVLYSFVSYNRKMIAPSDCNGSCNCTPTPSLPWRIAFIVFCALIVNLATGLYFSQQLAPYFTGDARYTDLILFSSQFLFQYIAFRLLKQRNFSDYAGNLAFVSLLGALLLLFFHFGLNILSAAGMHIELLQPLCYGIVYMFMLREHARRLQLLHLTKWLTVSWIVFRFLIYPFAFIV